MKNMIRNSYTVGRVVMLVLLLGAVFLGFPQERASAQVAVPAYEYLLNDGGLLLRGHRGPATRDLQEALTTLGWYAGVVNGRFGPKTQKALKDFQKSSGLIADGVVGSATRLALQEALFPKRSSPFSAIVAIASEYTDVQEDTICEPITVATPNCTLDQGGLVCTSAYQGLVEEYVARQDDAIGSVVAIDISDTEIAGIVLDMVLDPGASDWSLHVAESKEANGWGGDGALGAGAELQIHDNLISLFRDETVHVGVSTVLAHQEKLPEIDSPTRLIIEITNNQVIYTWGEEQTILGTIKDSNLFHFGDERPERLFIGVNRAVGDSVRAGSGVEQLGVTLLGASGQVYGAQEAVFSPECLDLVSPGVEQVENMSRDLCSLSLVTGAWECDDDRIVLDSYDSATATGLVVVPGVPMRITAKLAPGQKGWTLNIGDSPTNNGWGGDAGTERYDAELQVYNGLVSIFRREEAVFLAGLSHMFKSVTLPAEVVENGGVIEFVISDNALSYRVFDPAGKALDSQAFADDYLFALDAASGEADVVYIGVNQVVAGSRKGDGVAELQIELLQ